MIPFEVAWDTITKNDLRTIPQLSPKQQAALESYQQNVDAAVGEPEIEDVRDEPQDDACCRSLKEAINAIPNDAFCIDEMYSYMEDQMNKPCDHFPNGL